MSIDSFAELVQPAVSAVFETMFFSETLGPSDSDPEPGNVEARVAFSGETSGTVAVRISQSSARSMAAAFLGESDEAITETQVHQVVCELTNMLCGWIVSNTGSQGCFSLGSPELVSSGSREPVPALQQSFAIENGTLTVSLYTNART